MSAEEVSIIVSLSGEWHDDPPKFKLYIDDTLIDSGQIEERHDKNEAKSIRWTGSLEEGDHMLRVVFFDKTDKDTKLEDGEIVADKLLRIEEVTIDDIDLGHLVYKLCEFYPDKSIRPDLPDMIPNLTNIGYNGECQLKFQVPTYLWLLEHF
jgi:hypothetical protein